MLDTLITSKTRVKLLLKFFLNARSKSYLRNLETEFGESTNAIRIELNRFEQAGLLKSSVEGNRKYFTANVRHPLFPEINSIIKKYIGFDQIIDNVVGHLGGLQRAYLTGDLALGKDSKVIDLVLVGKDIDTDYLDHLISKAESVIKRKIHYTIVPSAPARDPEKSLLIWENKLS